MKKILLLVLFLILTGSIFAQPMHYNALSGMGNTFPLGQAAGKFTNWLFPPGVFNQPTPCPTGYKITKIYVRMYGSGARTYTNLHILMAQTTLTNLTLGQFYPGTWDTVFVKDTTLTSSGANTWMPIQLHTPYAYDPTKALVVGMGHCGGTGSGMYLLLDSLTGIKRTWSVGGCPFVPYAGGDFRVLCMGIDVQPLPGPVPDIIYYRFENNPSYRTVLNYAIPGQSSGSGILNGTTALTSGGQFDSCIIGNGVSGGGVNTRWNCSLGSGSWTISMWVHIPSDLTGVGYYLFGDAGSNSFRCFHYGISGSNYNLRLRSAGMTDVVVNGIGPAPTVVHIVYNSAASEIRTYKNGVYNSTVPQTPLNLPAGSGFWVGGYPAAYPTMKGRMDEFRVYSRALDSTEIALTWNTELPLLTSIPTPVLNMPVEFALSQNYPNPFNPTTTIEYKIPTKELVILKVYDILGKEITTLVNGVKKAGSYNVDFNSSNLPSGTYFYRLEAGDNLDVKKMLLIK